MGLSITDLITGSKAADKVLDMVGKAGDAAIHTAEERANLLLKTQQLFAEQNGPRSVSRRYIAWGVVLQTFLVLNTSIILILFSAPEMSKDIINVADTLLLPWAFVATIGFYFGNHIAEKITGKK